MSAGGQNRSAAVMQQRAEPHDSLDFFPTPPWATRALCNQLLSLGYDLSRNVAWDPACGQGDMVRPLRESFDHAYGSDVFDYGCDEQDCVRDFLLGPPQQPVAFDRPVDWIITNPPFRLGAEFIERALDIARIGVAVLVRTGFLEGRGRAETLFFPNPPAHIFQMIDRVVMAKGRLRDPAVKYRDPADGQIKTPSTATAYCWILWTVVPVGATTFDWIGRNRREFERPGDYPGNPPEEQLDRPGDDAPQLELT